MDNKKKGNKHTCSKCNTKFYDLEKLEIICPKCGNGIEKKTDNQTILKKEKEGLVLNADIIEDNNGDISYDDEEESIDEEVDDKELENLN